MDAKDLRTEAALCDRSKDGPNKYSHNGVLPCGTNKSYQDISSNPLAKLDIPTTRPCAVIGPDRVLPPSTIGDAYMKKGQYETWPSTDNTYRHPPEYPHKMTNYPSPLRNISPRQTFQENMQRIMVAPTYNNISEDNFTVDSNTALTKNSKSIGSIDPKYCDVPYSINTVSDNQKNTEMCASNVNNNRNCPPMWHPSGVNIRPVRPYGATELYQYPEYGSCAAPRSATISRQQNTINESPSHQYADTYYHHQGNVRFRPYPNIKDRYAQSRYDYINNYPNPFNPSPSFPTHKFDLPKPLPNPAYPQVPIKYLENRINEYVIDGYQRNPQQVNYNLPYQNQMIHPTYGPMLSNNLQNKLYPYQAESSVKSMPSNKVPFDNNKVYLEYENGRNKIENFYVNEMTRPHMKNQVIIPTYPTMNMQSIPPHAYYRKFNHSNKNYEYAPHLRHADPSIITNNYLTRFTSDFSPIAMSPPESNTSIDNLHSQGSFEDCGYMSQSSTASIRSIDSNVNRVLSSDVYRRYNYPIPHVMRSSPTTPKLQLNLDHVPNSKDKKGIDIRQFLEMWNEGDEGSSGNTKEIISQMDYIEDANKVTQKEIKNQEQLYVLGSVNVPSEELGKYEHIQKISKLPDNIKGCNNIELLKHFEEVIESSNLNSFNNHKISSPRNLQPVKPILTPGSVIPTRPLSPLDVEAKISQSVIHKEVGCNFEIKPCSPQMLNVEAATPIQNLLGERVIEKVSNPYQSPISGILSNDISCGESPQNHITKKNEISSCKLINTQCGDSVNSIKDNYSLQDLESNSGVCLASLPRLDNDIELSFPEVNQQFINANKESVIITKEIQNETKEVVRDNFTKDDIKNTTTITPTRELEKEFPKLSKYRKNKKSDNEIRETNLIRSSQIIRTDSVIIKNPDNTRSIEETESLLNNVDKIHNESNFVPPTKLFESSTEHKTNITNQEPNEIAIDFSMNKTHTLSISSNDIPEVNEKTEPQIGVENIMSKSIPKANEETSTPINIENINDTDAITTHCELLKSNVYNKDVTEYEQEMLTQTADQSINELNENFPKTRNFGTSSKNIIEANEIETQKDIEKFDDKKILSKDIPEAKEEIESKINIDNIIDTNTLTTHCDVLKSNVYNKDVTGYEEEISQTADQSVSELNKNYPKTHNFSTSSKHRTEANETIESQKNIENVDERNVISIDILVAKKEIESNINIGNINDTHTMTTDYDLLKSNVDNKDVTGYEEEMSTQTADQSISEFNKNCPRTHNLSVSSKIITEAIEKTVSQKDIENFNNANIKSKDMTEENEEIEPQINIENINDTNAMITHGDLLKPNVYNKDITEYDNDVSTQTTDQSISENCCKTITEINNFIQDIIPDTPSHINTNNNTSDSNQNETPCCMMPSENTNSHSATEYNKSNTNENIEDDFTVESEVQNDITSLQNILCKNESIASPFTEPILCKQTILNEKTVNTLKFEIETEINHNVRVNIVDSEKTQHKEINIHENHNLSNDDLVINEGVYKVGRCNIRKELFSPWIQKLIWCNEDTELSITRPTILSNANKDSLLNSSLNFELQLTPSRSQPDPDELNEMLSNIVDSCQTENAKLLTMKLKDNVVESTETLSGDEGTKISTDEPSSIQSPEPVENGDYIVEIDDTNHMLANCESHENMSKTYKDNEEEGIQIEVTASDLPRTTLKRSYSDSVLINISEDSDHESSIWSKKRRKNNVYHKTCDPGLYPATLSIQNNRRNSMSSTYNEDNLSFCIVIDNNCIITEENEEDDKSDSAETSANCLAEINNTHENEMEVNATTDIILYPQEDCEYPEPFVLEISDEQSWVDDIGCVETVVSDEVMEDITVSAQSSPKSEDCSEHEESDLFSSVSDHTEKVKYIYGDKMCNDDAELVETLYRTPQMNVNKTLTYRESHESDNIGELSVHVESALPQCDQKCVPRNIEVNLHDSIDRNFCNVSDLEIPPLIENATNVLQNNSDEAKNAISTFEIKEKTQYDTINSCESSLDSVFLYNQEGDPSSPEVSSTTSEEKNSTILLKITNYKGMRTSQLNDTLIENNNINRRNSCKFTETKNYTNCDNLSKPRPLITKAAQKYIPPAEEPFDDLKVKLPLPQHSLLKLKQLKMSKSVPKHINAFKQEISKKPKPKFEDVLKSIDEIQFKMHKERNKKNKKPVPKVVIKKNENGAHYTSPSDKHYFNPDLTGRKWQPWVFIEKNYFIDKMATKNKTKAIFSHRKNAYVFADKFRKYKSVSNAKFIISQPKLDNPSIGQLKYTIRLKHTY